MIGVKVNIFVFRRVALFLEFGVWTRPQDLWPLLTLETGMNPRRDSSRYPGSGKGVLIACLATDIKHNFISRKIRVYSQI